MKILIVEDEEALAKVLKEKFEKENFEARLIKNGDEAVSAALDLMPDIILLDLILPQKNGIEALKELKSHMVSKTIPVIVLSNLDSDADIKTALACGAADYFVKTQHPISEVVEKVINFLENPKPSPYLCP